MTRARRPEPEGASRRGFLAGAATAAAGAVAGFPMIARAQSAATFRFQGAWSAKDIFHEYALDFGKKVNDMTGGEVRIEVLPAGAVAPEFGLLEAVSKGALDGGHGTLAYHYPKQQAFALWGSGPAFGMDANMLLAWHKYGGGRELLAKLYQSINANVVSFIYGPMPTQPLGWFRKPVTGVESFKGLRFGAVGVAAELFTAMGAKVSGLPSGEIVPAMSRALLDAAEFNNVASDNALGFADVSKTCMLQSYHQNAEQLEILFNKTKFDALPPRTKTIVENAVEAASADMSWKAIHRYSRDHIELQEKRGVRFHRTPNAVLQRQLAEYDRIAAKQKDNALFLEIEQSQRSFAQRAVKWQLDTQVSAAMAHDHYFGKTAQTPGKRRTN
jgi:TRAP-type mannitol/chloroaromatic compound transport system substrate-binding protein